MNRGSGSRLINNENNCLLQPFCPPNCSWQFVTKLQHLYFIVRGNTFMCKRHQLCMTSCCNLLFTSLPFFCVCVSLSVDYFPRAWQQCTHRHITWIFSIEEESRVQSETFQNGLELLKSDYITPNIVPAYKHETYFRRISVTNYVNLFIVKLFGVLHESSLVDQKVFTITCSWIFASIVLLTDVFSCLC